MQDSPMDEDGEGEDMSLELDSGPSTFGAQPMTTGPLHAGYHITVHEDADASHPTPLGQRWATIRNRGGKWVIGNAHQGLQGLLRLAELCTRERCSNSLVPCAVNFGSKRAGMSRPGESSQALLTTQVASGGTFQPLR